MTLTSAPGANPEVGTLELVAETGQIEKHTLGGIQLFVKNVCMS